MTSSPKILEHKFYRDTVFKTLFTKNPNLLKHFVAELLRINYDEITAFALKNPELMPLSTEGKLCRLDLCIEVYNKQIDIEIQINSQQDYPERTLYYCADLFASGLPKGIHNKYTDAPQAITISLVKFNLFPETQEYVSRFRMMEEKRLTQLADKMLLIYYELPKLPKPKGIDNTLLLWLSLFNSETEEDLANLKNLGVPMINEAIETYSTVVVSDEFREIERSRRLAERDYSHDMACAIEEGIEKGYLKAYREMGLEPPKKPLAKP